MKIVYPKDVNKYDIQTCLSAINLFMGGGMGNLEWQKTFLETLKLYNIGDSLTIFNPYNPDIKDMQDQILWEQEAISLGTNDNVHFIGSLYFDKYTNQPMSCLELGRMAIESRSKEISVYVDSKRTKIMINYGYPLIVSVHPECPIKEEIKAQCYGLRVNCAERNPQGHAQVVYRIYRDIKSKLC
jgi:hypothetical protein